MSDLSKHSELDRQINMKVGQEVLIDLNDNGEIVVNGKVTHVRSNKMVTIEVSMIINGKTIRGFHKQFSDQWTLRKDGNWYRRGVNIGRGWKIIG